MLRWSVLVIVGCSSPSGTYAVVLTEVNATCSPQFHTSTLTFDGGSVSVAKSSAPTTIPPATNVTIDGDNVTFDSKYSLRWESGNSETGMESYAVSVDAERITGTMTGSYTGSYEANPYSCTSSFTLQGSRLPDAAGSAN